MEPIKHFLPALKSFFNKYMTGADSYWLHAGTEVLMALVFYLLGGILIYFFFTRKKDLKLRWSLLPVLFFFFTGTVHAVHVAAPWFPVYGYETVLKLISVLFALAAVAFIEKKLPSIFAMPLPSQTRSLHENHDRMKLELEQKKTEWETACRNFETELRQWEDGLQLLPALNEALAETGTFHEALEITVEKICQTMNWEYGEAWVVPDNGKVLEYSPVWYGGPQFEELRRVTKELRFPLHIGLPGLVWALKKPQVILDIFSDPNGAFFQAPPCREMGLKSAVGVPVFSGEKVSAVMIFLMHDISGSRERSLCMVSSIAAQLGLILERKVSEKALQDAQEATEKKVRERTKELLKSNESLKAEIEERRHSEESLRKSQQNFSTLVNSIDGIVYEYDLGSLKFSFVSEQAERTLGYPVSAWMAEPAFWLEHIHGQDRPAVLAFRSRVIREKKDESVEYRMITADGQNVWMRDMVNVVIEGDQVVKLRGVMVNITEPKQVQEALHQERNFVSAVFETAGALVMVLDTEGRIVRFNRACEQTSGYTAEEAKGKYFWELFSAQDEVARSKMIFTRLLAGQFPINDESFWVAKDGSRRSIAWSNTVILNKYGAVIHVIATGIDITKRKEAEFKLTEAVNDLARSNKELDKFTRELKDANQRLRELDQVKSHFISAASHELRTPLTSIKGYVESILEDEVGPLNEQQRQFLEYVKVATDRLHRLLNELLDISKIESGRVRMNKNLTNLQDLLKEEVMIFKTQAQNKGINLDIQTDSRLRSIYCDADKIREVMDNLLNNAIKYTPKGGAVRIEAGNDDKGGVKINVRDTGIGIAKEDMLRIFEPFQHIEKEGMEDEEESTGLGLALVKRIVEAHEGNVTVQSQLGNGSLFTVSLPAGNPSEKNKNSLVLIENE